MKRNPDELRRMIERFAAVLRDARIRLTPQRLEIYRQTASTTAHPDIETIHSEVRKAMPCVSLDTVYRALELFAELGLVSNLRPFPGPLRFDANTTPHHHFVCTQCGATFDFEHREFDDLSIPASASVLGRVVSRHLELRGLCAPCAAGAANAPHSGAPRPIGTRSHRKDNASTRRD